MPPQVSPEATRWNLLQLAARPDWVGEGGAEDVGVVEVVEWVVEWVVEVLEVVEVVLVVVLAAEDDVLVGVEVAMLTVPMTQ
jgi:hypothetical protein